MNRTLQPSKYVTRKIDRVSSIYNGILQDFQVLVRFSTNTPEFRVYGMKFVLSAKIYIEVLLNLYRKFSNLPQFRSTLRAFPVLEKAFMLPNRKVFVFEFSATFLSVYDPIKLKHFSARNLFVLFSVIFIKTYRTSSCDVKLNLLPCAQKAESKVKSLLIKLSFVFICSRFLFSFKHEKQSEYGLTEEQVAGEHFYVHEKMCCRS